MTLISPGRRTRRSTGLPSLAWFSTASGNADLRPAPTANLFTAIRESLGPMLEVRTAPVEMLIIEHIEGPDRELIPVDSFAAPIAEAAACTRPVSHYRRFRSARKSAIPSRDRVDGRLQQYPAFAGPGRSNHYAAETIRPSRSP